MIEEERNRVTSRKGEETGVTSPTRKILRKERTQPKTLHDHLIQVVRGFDYQRQTPQGPLAKKQGEDNSRGKKIAAESKTRKRKKEGEGEEEIREYLKKNQHRARYIEKWINRWAPTVNPSDLRQITSLVKTMEAQGARGRSVGGQQKGSTVMRGIQPNKKQQPPTILGIF